MLVHSFCIPDNHGSEVYCLKVATSPTPGAWREENVLGLTNQCTSVSLVGECERVVSV